MGAPDLDSALCQRLKGVRPPGELRDLGHLKAGDTCDLRLYVFDLLRFEDWDLRALPLTERKAALASIVPALPHVPYVDHVTERGEELAEVVRRGGLPGVIAKRSDAPYRAGASDDWVEIPVDGGAGTEDTSASASEAPAEEAAAKPATVGELPTDTAGKVAWCREHDAS